MDRLIRHEEEGRSFRVLGSAAGDGCWNTASRSPSVRALPRAMLVSSRHGEGYMSMSMP